MLEIQFAPLQGYTDAAYRRFHNEIYGNSIGCYFSPFIRLERGFIRPKDLKDILPENNIGVNLVPQIIVNSVNEFNNFVNAITTLGYNKIDLNLGCPFPLQTGKGRGAGLLPKADTIKDIFTKIGNRDDVLFSIKMRLGLNDKCESLKLLPIINDTPLRQVVIHPRIGCQQYKGIVDKEAFTQLYEEIIHPVVYNGDIQSVEDIENIAMCFPKLKSVMIGRGLLTNPSLGMEYIQGNTLSIEQKLTLYKELHAKMFDYYKNVLQGDAQLLMKMKSMWDYQEPIIGRKVLKSIKKSTTIAKYRAVVSAIQ